MEDNTRLEDDHIDHVSSSVDTPLREDAFEMSDEEKIDKISHHFGQIMETLGT